MVRAIHWHLRSCGGDGWGEGRTGWPLDREVAKPVSRRVGRKFGALGLCSVPAMAIADGIWKPEKDWPRAPAAGDWKLALAREVSLKEFGEAAITQMLSSNCNAKGLQTDLNPHPRGPEEMQVFGEALSRPHAG